MLLYLLLSWKEWDDYGSGFSTHAAMGKGGRRQSSHPSVMDSKSKSNIVCINLSLLKLIH